MVRPSLTNEAAATVIHAFVTSRLDNSNAILYGFPLPPTSTDCANAAARTLTLASN